MSRLAKVLAAAVLAVLSLAAAAGAMDIRDVEAGSGVHAWLVEDYTVPVVTIAMSFKGGTTQDPDGREGLVNLMTSLMDEGAGDLDSDAFKVALDEAGAELRISADRDATRVRMRMLADRRAEALALLKLAISKPRFDQQPLARLRGQIIAGIVAGERDPESQARDRWRAALYGTHAYSRPPAGTAASLEAIGADDLAAAHRAIFARDGVTVAAVGAIDAATLSAVLDDLFGGLAEKGALRPIPPATPHYGQEVRVDYPLAQTTLQLAMPGIARQSPDYFAAYLMNHILGGSAFTSRLFTEIREKRGLAYGVSSYLVDYDAAAMLVIDTATRPDKAGESLAIIRSVMKGLADDGPTEAELQAAKKYLIGAFAINSLDSSTAIASTLVSLQVDDLGIDYMDKRAGLIERVTIEDVRRIARLLLSAEPAILVVGGQAGGQ